MRYSRLAFSILGTWAFLTTACATRRSHKEAENKEVRREEPAQKEGSREEHKGLVEKVRERLGFGGCDMEVIAKTPGAVGNPCETTAKFMKDQGLSAEQIAQVSKLAAALEARGETRQAH